MWISSLKILSTKACAELLIFLQTLCTISSYARKGFTTFPQDERPTATYY